MKKQAVTFRNSLFFTPLDHAFSCRFLTFPEVFAILFSR